MKYLKLFESYKETTDSINHLIDKYESEKGEIINDYKKFIDDLLLDISDDYNCEFISEYGYLRKIKNEDNFLKYRISFPIEKIDDFFEKLKGVLDDIVHTGISYTIDSIDSYKRVGDSIRSCYFNSKPKTQLHPHCIVTSKSEIIKSVIESDGYSLYISF